MTLSVVLVNYNTRDLTRECLASLYRETVQTDLEVILVDNGSTDGSADMVAREFPGVVLLRNPCNEGFSRANNQGIAVARGEYILLLNTDTVVLDRAVEKTLAFMRAHPEADVAGCRLLNADRSTQPSARSFPNTRNLFWLATLLNAVFPKSRVFGQFDLTWFGYDRVLEVDTVIGAFLMAKRSAFGLVGGFDEKFYFYGDEADLLKRMRDAGCRVFFFPGADVVHYGGGSIRNPLMYYRNLHNSYLRMLRKHYRGAEFAAALLFLKAAVAVRVPVYLAAGAFTFDRTYVAKAWYYLLNVFETAGLDLERGYRYDIN